MISSHSVKYEKIREAIDNLNRNEDNHVTFWDDGRRVLKSFHQVRVDIEAARSRLHLPGRQMHPTRVSILGPACYQWLILDLACIYSGVMVLAVPETIPETEYYAIVEEHSPDLQFIHTSLAEKFQNSANVVIFGNADDVCQHSFEKNPVGVPPQPQVVDRDVYTIGFSSGTQGIHRILHIPYPDLSRSIDKFKRPNKWFRKEQSDPTKIFIWMSFSHYLQRWLALQALAFKFDLVLSTSRSCLGNLISEKPTFMVSAPILYHLLAECIDRQASRFNYIQKAAHRIYLKFGINRLHWKNPIRRTFDSIFFSSVRRVYGGRPEQFNWSGACINKDALATLDRFGVQVFGGYALSEIGPVSSDYRETFRIGSVGKPNREVRISEVGEVLVRYDGDVRDSSQLSVDEHGFIRTGDFGYFDNDGYLYIAGRIDDLIILSNGKNIRPQIIEDALLRTGMIRHALVFSRDGSRLCAVIEARENTVSVAAAINAANATVRQYERVHEYYITQNLFGVIGLVTPSQKLRRKVAAEMFRDTSFQAIGCTTTTKLGEH